VALWRLPRPDFHRLVEYRLFRRTTHVTAYMLAKSPPRPSTRRLQRLRCLYRCSDCYRVERTSSRVDSHPLWSIRLRTAH